MNFIGHLGRSLRQSRLAPVLEPSMWRASFVALGVVLAGAALWAFREIDKPGGEAKIRRVRSDLSAIQFGLEVYKLNAGHYPSMEQGLAALSEIPQTEPLPKEWIKITDGIPIDPWGNEYRYRLHEGVTVRETEVWSCGKDGEPGTKDDISSLDP